MMYVLIAFCVLFAIGAAVAVYEAKRAVIVDDKEPFLLGDYDPKKDPTLKFSVDVDKVECSETAKIINLKAEKE